MDASGIGCVWSGLEEGDCGMDSRGWLWMHDGMAGGLEVEGA